MSDKFVAELLDAPDTNAFEDEMMQPPAPNAGLILWQIAMFSLAALLLIAVCRWVFRQFKS